MPDVVLVAVSPPLAVDATVSICADVAIGCCGEVDCGESFPEDVNWKSNRSESPLAVFDLASLASKVDDIE